MASRRYLIWFFSIAGAVIAACIGFNFAADAYILNNPNGASVQLVSGFERVIKPAWLVAIQPSTVFIGTSRARLAFDPRLIDPIFHLLSFNYGVSSESAYEARRYIQDVAAQSNVKTIVVALDAFASGSAAQPFGGGFDETRLAVTPDGQPTPRRDLWLFTSRFLSGGALGMHALGAWLLLQLHDGQTPADRPDLFAAYAKMTPAIYRHEMMRRAGRSMVLTPWRNTQIDAALAALCHNPAKVYWFFPPDNFALIARYAANDPTGFSVYKSSILARVRAHNAQCTNQIRLFDFMNLNAITKDDSAAHGKASLYYEDPIHIRPQTGLILLHRMWGSVAAKSALPGIDLTADPHAEADIAQVARDAGVWLRTHKDAICPKGAACASIATTGALDE